MWSLYKPNLSYWHLVEPCWDRCDWLKHLRMSKETFHVLNRELQPILQKKMTRFRQPIPVSQRLAMALWRLATGTDYRTLGQLFGVGRSTYCEVTHEVCKAIVDHLLPRFVTLAAGQRLQEVKTAFYVKSGLRQCVGVIDGTHIPILAPPDHHVDYFNRKGFHSVVLQAIVDSQGSFQNINIGWPGRAHDARVLANSEVYAKGQSGTLFPQDVENINGVNIPHYLVGDPAYPLLPWLLKVFPGGQCNLTREELLFNKSVCKARFVVEHAFGRLKGRWRCLLKRNDTTLQYLITQVAACCVLHNICLLCNEEYPDDWLPDADCNPYMERNANDAVGENALEIREALKNFLAEWRNR